MNALLHARETRATWRVTGADRLDYLHRMLTQDVQRLPVGQAAYACYLTVKGRILGDLLLWNAGEHLLLELEADAVPAVVPALERYVITDDVTFEDVTASTRRYVLAGPDAAAALESAGFEVPASESFVAIECGGSPGHVLRFDRRGLTSFEIAVLPDAAEDLVERLGVPQDEHRFAALCVQHAIPRFGHELGDEVLFNEAGLEEAVSWNKGCYPGQEPVVMAKHRGRPPRLLVQLEVAAGGAPAPGSVVLVDDREVGHVTSSADMEDGKAVALAYVKHAFAEDGRDVTLAGGAEARIRVPLVETA